jgi:hypothetical protein
VRETENLSFILLYDNDAFFYNSGKQALFNFAKVIGSPVLFFCLLSLDLTECLEAYFRTFFLSIGIGVL